MLWEGRRESENVEDRRGIGGGQVAMGGGLIGLVFMVIYFFVTGEVPNPQSMPMPTEQTQPMSPQQQARSDERFNFIKVALADTEDAWNKIFAEHGERYQPPVLVTFTGATSSACGTASSAVGPFYCPSDQRVYMDLGFADELNQRFGASKGNFALAYVLAHEVGHHIQNLMGTTDQMERLRGRVNDATYNRYSVALELQADFYAGVWAHYTQKMKNVIKPEDIQEALTAAAAVGDDNIQERTQGHVVPDAFTHGTSQQRMFWFKKGYETGDIAQGNTFKALGLQ